MRIPKIFHRIWLGGNKMPKNFVRYGETWGNNHPGWEMKLWTDNNLPAMFNKKIFDMSVHYSMKSDILRYEVVYMFGGVYIDTDFECFKNIEALIQDLEFFTGYTQQKHINSAIFGATKNNPLMKSLIVDGSKSFAQNYSRDIWAVMEQIGPTYFSNHVSNFVSSNKTAKIFDAKFFYPYNPFHIGQKSQNTKAYPEAYGAHHWSMTWVR